MLYFYFRRKPKAKAPLPPAETKNLDASPVDDSLESSAFIMEQKESMIDRDTELSVVLPGGVIKSTTIHGRYVRVNEMPFLLLPSKPSVVYLFFSLTKHFTYPSV